MALRLCTEHGALRKLYKGKLKSTDSVSVAKRAFPPLGPLYGLLSNHFVHIGAGHAHFEPTIEYTPDDPALPFIIANMRATALLIYVIAELVLYKNVGTPRYWMQTGENGFSYSPSASEHEWMTKFVSDVSDIEKRLKTLTPA